MHKDLILRTGRTVGRTLYDAGTDTLIGVVDTPELADAIVHAVAVRNRRNVTGDVAAFAFAVVEQGTGHPVCAVEPGHYADAHLPGGAWAGVQHEHGVDLTGERPELAADPFDAARRYLAGPAHDVDPMTSSRLLVEVMNRIDGHATSEHRTDGYTDEGVSTVSAAEVARPETPGDMAEQIRWLARRVADEQHEFDAALDRLAAAAEHR